MTIMNEDHTKTQTIMEVLLWILTTMVSMIM